MNGNGSVSFTAYRAWLRERWSIPMDGDAAVEEERFDPREPLGDVAEKLGLAEEKDASRGLTSDQATLFVGRSLLREGERLRGRAVWEVGCGTGVLSALAGRLGARRVLATDVCPESVALARRTGERNEVRIETGVADLFAGAAWNGLAVDVLIADLPQKPVKGGSLPPGQDGGPDGSRFLLPFLEEAPKRLAPGGRLYFFAHSLTHPQAMVRLHQLFRPRVLSYMWRLFDRDAMGAIYPYLCERREQGLCRFWDLPEERHAFLCMLFSAEPAEMRAP